MNFRSVRTIKNDEKEICNREKMLKDYTNLCENLGLQMRNVVKPMQSHLEKVQIVTGKVLKNEPDIYVKIFENRWIDNTKEKYSIINNKCRLYFNDVF